MRVIVTSTNSDSNERVHPSRRWVRITPSADHFVARQDLHAIQFWLSFNRSKSVTIFSLCSANESLSDITMSSWRVWTSR